MTKILLNDWILKFGTPKVIHADCGRTFTGKMMNDLAKECGIDLEFSSPYHHSSNGLIERQFRTIRDAINTRLKDGHTKDWSDVEYTLNATHQKSIETSPAEAVFGRI